MNQFRHERIHPPEISKTGRVYKYRMLEEYLHYIGFRKGATADLDFLSLDKLGILTIRKGYAWDGPSGPALDTTNFIRGSAVHDSIYQLIRMGILPMKARRRADKILRKIIREDGMNRFRAFRVYLAVRMFGRKSAR